MSHFKHIIPAFTIPFLVLSGTSLRKNAMPMASLKLETSNKNYNISFYAKDSLIAWYKFTSGSLKDLSGKNNHIVFNNARLTSDRFGKTNNAYAFNGNGSYMLVKNSASLNPKIISMMVILKVNGFYSGKCLANNILSKGYNDYADGFYAMRYTNLEADCLATPDPKNECFTANFGDNFRPYYGSAAGVSAASLPIVTNKWYNVIYTYDGNVSKIYINGLLRSTLKKTTSFRGNADDLYIGKHGDPSYPYFINGIIDEIRMYKKVLSQNEVTFLNSLKD